jgi:transposase
VVFDVAAELNIHIQQLPAYSPDFRPVEHLWQWLREDVTYHTCFQKKADLIEQVAFLQTQINQTTLAVVDRLWVKITQNQQTERNYWSHLEIIGFKSLPVLT